jgi:hypothetical protein
MATGGSIDSIYRDEGMAKDFKSWILRAKFGRNLLDLASLS